MGERSLVNAIKTVHDPAATWQSLLSAADNLLRWGALDDADAAIDRLRGHEKTKAAAAAMAATTRQLRRSGVLSAFSPVGYQETGNLNRPYEALVARGGAHADKAIVVFTGTDRKFWMSLQVLYHFLRKLGAHVIYLSDHSNTQFLNGLHSIGGGYQGLVARVNQLVEGLGVTRKFVMASSAGGFVGLRAAADLNSEAFLGMGIRTAMTADSGLPLGNYEKAAVNRCRDKDVLTNLRAYLASRKTPGRVLLYCGDGVKFDIAHAENLSGLPNVKVHMLPEYNEHNVMPGLIARGQFEGVLREFLAATEPNAPV